jgi:hypothetical protein
MYVKTLSKRLLYGPIYSRIIKTTFFVTILSVNNDVFTSLGYCVIDLKESGIFLTSLVL